MGTIPRDDMPVRAAQMFGLVKHKENGVETEEYSQMYNKERYQFMLFAPFEVSAMCCKVMKKAPVKKFAKETGRKPFTAQMACESRLRTSKWLKTGCNAFDGRNPISNPMSFWTEQDVLWYIRENNLQIASVYGDIVTDDEESGQMTLADLGFIFDCDKPCLHTTGCDRTGCMFCAYGLHLEKSPNRLERMSVTHPNLYDYVMRGGAFNDEGIFKPKSGLGYWFLILYINKFGNMNIKAPEIEKYRKQYSTEETEAWLNEEKIYDMIYRRNQNDYSITEQREGVVVRESFQRTGV